MAYKRTVDKPVEVMLPITPMLDMAFQLMFFFLATFNPSSTKEGQMELSLPSKGDKAARDPADVKTITESVKEDVDIPTEVTINIRGYRDPKNRGEISALSFSMASAGEEDIKGNGSDVNAQRADRDKQLREKLTGVKPPAAEGKDKQPKVPTVRVSADSNVRVQNVFQILDVCYRAGFQVSFAKPADSGTP